MSYQLDLIGADGKAATETHEDVQPTDAALYIRDGAKETWIPWGQIHVASRTLLDADVRKPDVQPVPGPSPGRRPAR